MTVSRFVRLHSVVVAAAVLMSASAPHAQEHGGLQLRVPPPASRDGGGTPAAAPSQRPSTGIRAPHALQDGTVAVSPIWMAAEMIRDEAAAKRKYAGKLIQFEAPLQRKSVAENNAQLTFLVTVPSQGYKHFWCVSFDPASIRAAAALSPNDSVTVAGIYQPNPMARFNRKSMQAVEDLGSRVNLGFLDTLRFDDCIVLTGNPAGERARAILAASAKSSGR